MFIARQSILGISFVSWCDEYAVLPVILILLCVIDRFIVSKAHVCPRPWKGQGGMCDRRADMCQSNADCEVLGGGKCCFNGCQNDCVQFGELSLVFVSNFKPWHETEQGTEDFLLCIVLLFLLFVDNS